MPIPPVISKQGTTGKRDLGFVDPDVDLGVRGKSITYDPG
jgi:hypothetical protein